MTMSKKISFLYHHSLTHACWRILDEIVKPQPRRIKIGNYSMSRFCSIIRFDFIVWGLLRGLGFQERKGGPAYIIMTCSFEWSWERIYLVRSVAIKCAIRMYLVQYE